jgi:hypothetical protein
MLKARYKGKGVLLVGLLLAGLSWKPVVAQAPELVRLIDSPTAGMLDKGRFGLDLRLFDGGGALGLMQAGALKRLMIGVSFGGEGLIGTQQVNWYPRAEVAVRYRLIQESVSWPAVVLGYETQGYGPFSAERYAVKSKGVFAGFSKNYVSSLGQIGMHGGVNLSFEDADGDDDISGWVGLDKSINEELGLVAEYDLAINDDSDRSLGTGRGYLNAGGYWALAPSLRVGFLARNLLGNGPGNPKVSRELSLRYSEDF